MQDALKAFASTNGTFEEWKQLWRERELSLLHHAPYRVDKCPSRVEWTKLLFETVIGELRNHKVGCVFALYTLYHTQPEPVQITAERARQVPPYEWRVPISIKPDVAAFLINLRADLLDAQNHDALHVLGRLLSDYDAVHVTCAPCEPVGETPTSARPSYSIDLAGIGAASREYAAALAPFDHNPTLRAARQRVAGLEGDLQRIIDFQTRSNVRPTAPTRSVRRDLLDALLDDSPPPPARTAIEAALLDDDDDSVGPQHQEPRQPSNVPQVSREEQTEGRPPRKRRRRPPPPKQQTTAEAALADLEALLDESS